ncbi:MAG: hypothetical protein ABIF82_13280 [Planctomycetota bacterium]
MRGRYPRFLEAHRSRAARAATALIVVIDADTRTVQNRQRQLDRACEEADNIQARQPHDAVAHIIPKRNIETWLTYLDGENVNEDDDYSGRRSFRRQESACHSLVDKLAEQCKNHEDPGDRPAALTTACEEFDRIRPILRN